MENDSNKRFTVKAGQKYVTPGTVFVEGDASSASYFLALGAITGGPVKVVGCGSESVQGDVKFANVLEQMGATVEWEANSITVSRKEGTKLKGVDVDCDEIPDAAMTLAPVALFAEGPTKIRNVYNWRLKECDRMEAICTEVSKRRVVAEVNQLARMPPPCSLPDQLSPVLPHPRASRPRPPIRNPAPARPARH